MIFAFSFSSQTALIQNNTEQGVRLSVPRIRRSNLSRGRFCLIQPARLQERDSVAESASLAVGWRADLS